MILSENIKRLLNTRNGLFLSANTLFNLLTPAIRAFFDCINNFSPIPTVNRKGGDRLKSCFGLIMEKNRIAEQFNNSLVFL